jgi:hypothetical protein
MVDSNKMIYDYNSVVKPDTKKIVEGLTCLLCKGIFRIPFTIVDCQCTFCRACIYKYFIKNNKKDNCPSCRTNLGGSKLKRMFYDERIDDLINILFPEFEELDKQECVL